MTHYLCFKLDQNHELCTQTLKVSHLLFNARRGNSVSDVVSFSHAPPTIEEYLNKTHKFNIAFFTFISLNTCLFYPKTIKKTLSTKKTIHTLDLNNNK